MNDKCYKSTIPYTQYRCGNSNLGSRVVDPALNMYDDAQLQWYESPVNIPEPARLVMFEIRRCYLCGDLRPGKGTIGNCESDVGIYHEGVGQHPYGYRMCFECKPYYLAALKKKIGLIWRFRQQFDRKRLSDSDSHMPVSLWVARTRYDEEGKRVRTGNMPFKYSSWHVARWSPVKYIDEYKAERDPTYVNEDCLVVASNDEIVTKLINIDDLFITNYGSIADPNYDPNTDDPLNKYSHEQRQRMREEEMQRLDCFDINI